jgi:glycosyltransferase involved in cell wall biosynthesis
VIAEALACGTPVIAMREGSVAEPIEDGVTGFICSSEEEMVAAVRSLNELDRERCRTEAERRFSPAAMATAYERLYDELVPESYQTYISGAA